MKGQKSYAGESVPVDFDILSKPNNIWNIYSGQIWPHISLTKGE